MKSFWRWFVAAGLATAATAHAALVLQPDGTQVLDTDTGLVWLYDWSASGSTNWSNADLWAQGLVAGVHDDWRLPGLDEYLALWQHAGSTLPGLQSGFANAVSGTWWTASALVDNPAEHWLFSTATGTGVFGGRFTRPAAAVRCGESGCAVPEPTSTALALVALAVLGWTGARRSGGASAAAPHG